MIIGKKDALKSQSIFLLSYIDREKSPHNEKNLANISKFRRL